MQRAVQFQERELTFVPATRDVPVMAIQEVRYSIKARVHSKIFRCESPSTVLSNVVGLAPVCSQDYLGMQDGVI